MTGNDVVHSSDHVKQLGWFIPILKEMVEMRYQYDRDYYFNSEKFRKAFQYKPLPNEEAVRRTVQSMPSR
jgi:nucleoside-diphosphate-sugar epimerase